MKKPKILIVDDSMTMRKIIINVLNKANYNDVMVAKDGEQALDIIKSGEDISAILLDWVMPKMNGLQVLEALQIDPKLKSIPVMMVTTRSRPEDIIEAIKKGAKTYIVKPFSVDTMKEKLDEMLK